MIEKDISELSKSELIEKYSRMKEFVIITGLAKNMSAAQIVDDSKKEIYNKPLEFVADNDKSIIIKALECTVYRNAKIKY